MSNLKLNSNVKFLSNLPRAELIKLYEFSHVFSLPSLVEGFGIATIEAAAAGLPYVNSKIPINSEVTHNGQGGYLVTPNSPIDFSDKFELLFKDKKLYEKKSIAAKKMSENYNWNVIAKQTELIYKSLLQND